MGEFFFDTSALVKRYHEEPGTERVDEMIDGEDNEILITSLTVIESVFAFRRKYNRGDVTESELDRLLGVFFREALDEFVIIPLEEALLKFSFELVLEDDLRTLDSLQLSAGLSLAREIDELRFVTADADLASIAEEHGLETVTPE